MPLAVFVITGFNTGFLPADWGVPEAARTEGLAAVPEKEEEEEEEADDDDDDDEEDEEEVGNLPGVLPE